MDRNELPFRKNCEGYFFDKSRRILARKINGILVFPGGGIEDNEDPKDAVARETFEETRAIVKDLKKIGELKFIWGDKWAKSEKQKRRYQEYKGEDMQFFVGTIEKFEENHVEKVEEDFWGDEKLIPITEAIKIIESQAPFDGEIKEYRKAQLKSLKEIQSGQY